MERDTDDRDCLSDADREYMLRYIQYELERQERVSDKVLGTAQSSFICDRYETDRAFFAAGDTSVGFTPA